MEKGGRGRGRGREAGEGGRKGEDEVGFDDVEVCRPLSSPHLQASNGSSNLMDRGIEGYIYIEREREREREKERDK